MALNPNVLYDVVAINAGSASTTLAGLPFSGPVGGVRVALIGDQWVGFPTVEQVEDATFDMVVAGRVPARRRRRDHDGRGRVHRGHLGPRPLRPDRSDRRGRRAGHRGAKPFIKALCDAQAELAAMLPKAVSQFPVFLDYQPDVFDAVAEAGTDRLKAVMSIAGKAERETTTEDLLADLQAELDERFPGREKEITGAFRALTKKVVRHKTLTEQVRIDGRGVRDIRTLSAEVGVLPRVHGSALFQRGETQILGVTTLNMLDMEQKLDTLAPETTKRYMHNYNFPPYSTGETGRVGSPKRREIGHGALAERALVPVLPSARSSPTRSVRSPRRWAPTAPPRWARSARRPWPC